MNLRTVFDDDRDYYSDLPKVSVVDVPSVQTRAAMGALWLDFHSPGWYNGSTATEVIKIGGEDFQRGQIDLDLLDLADSTECVLGQMIVVPNDDDAGDGYWRGTMWLREAPSKGEPLELRTYLDTWTSIWAMKTSYTAPDWCSFQMSMTEALGFLMWDEEGSLPEEQQNGYDELTQAWEDEITERRRADAKPPKRTIFQKLFRRQ